MRWVWLCTCFYGRETQERTIRQQKSYFHPAPVSREDKSTLDLFDLVEELSFFYALRDLTTSPDIIRKHQNTKPVTAPTKARFEEIKWCVGLKKKTTTKQKEKQPPWRTVLCCGCSVSSLQSASSEFCACQNSSVDSQFNLAPPGAQTTCLNWTKTRGGGAWKGANISGLHQLPSDICFPSPIFSVSFLHGRLACPRGRWTRDDALPSHTRVGAIRSDVRAYPPTHTHTHTDINLPASRGLLFPTPTSFWGTRGVCIVYHAPIACLIEELYCCASAWWFICFKLDQRRWEKERKRSAQWVQMRSKIVFFLI